MRRFVMILLLLIQSSHSLGENEFRIWRDILGREFEAKMVSSTSTKVLLENRKGIQKEMYTSDFFVK